MSKLGDEIKAVEVALVVLAVGAFGYGIYKGGKWIADEFDQLGNGLKKLFGSSDATTGDGEDASTPVLSSQQGAALNPRESYMEAGNLFGGLE